MIADLRSSLSRKLEEARVRVRALEGQIAALDQAGAEAPLAAVASLNIGNVDDIASAGVRTRVKRGTGERLVISTLTSAESLMTPNEIAAKSGVSAVNVRRILRSLYAKKVLRWKDSWHLIGRKFPEMNDERNGAQS